MKYLLKISLGLIFIMSLATKSTAQDVEKVRSLVGPEIQVYPTGIIPGLKYEAPIGTLSTLYLRAGYQIIDHRDLGVQDDETGSGYGFSLGYKRYLRADQSKWAFMLKSDVWFNTIDWVDTDIAGMPTSGQSKITVLQPTLQAEYGFKLSENVILSPSAAFGLEWNVSTDGVEVGEGPILLLGVSLGFLL